jgi:hypothetical protein
VKEVLAKTLSKIMLTHITGLVILKEDNFSGKGKKIMTHIDIKTNTLKILFY